MHFLANVARIIVSLALLTLLVAAPASAQGTNATILGTVRDQSELAVPGVTVTAVNTETGFSRDAVTGEAGTYRLAGLPPGKYDVKASLTGFAEQVRQGVTLIVLQELTLDFKVQLATLDETVTVHAEVPLVDVNRSDVSAAVLQEQILALPLSSRTFTDLALVLPGVNADQRRHWSDPVNIGSGGPFQTNYLMDGANNVWMKTGEARMNFMQDSVREFKVINSGFKAEHGNSATGLVVGVSKSGTNVFHGSGFEFFRHKTLNAKAAFETEKPPYRRQQFGGTIGGPIRRDRLFFFGALERLVEKSFINFSSGGVYPSVEGLIEQPITQTLGTFKLDATLSPRHSVFIRWALQRKEWLFSRTGGNTAKTSGQDLDYPRDSVVFGLTSVFSRVVNDLRISFGKTDALQHPSFPHVQGLTFDSMVYGGQSAFEPQWEERLEINDDFGFHKSGWVGEHNFKMGVSLNPYIPVGGTASGRRCQNGCYRISGDVPGFPDVPIPWDSLAAQGRILQLRIGFLRDDPKVNFTLYGAYVQDDWRPTANLTLNLGLRWDYQPTLTLKHHGRPFVGTFKIPGVYDRSTRKADLNNFGPRFGFAYDVAGEHRTVIRGDAGVFYGVVHTGFGLYNEWKGQDGANADLVTIVRPNLTNWENPLAEIGNPQQYASAVPSIFVVANDYKNPTAFQMGIGVSRELAANLSLDVDYVRIRGWHEVTGRNLNAPDPVTGRRLTDDFLTILQRQSSGYSNYNALLVRLEKRLTNKLQLLASYTLAKANNVASRSGPIPSDSNRLQDEFGPAQADRRHRLAFSGISAALPADLQFSWVLSAASSRPFDVLAGRDLNRDREFTDRPPGVTRNQGCRTLDLAAVNAFRQANGGPPVDSVECPGRFTLDVRLGRNFRFGESIKLELFLEVYNLTNAKNLEHNLSGEAYQEVQALAATFGRTTVAGFPRQAALAARFSF